MTKYRCITLPLILAGSLYSPISIGEITLDGSMGSSGSLVGPNYQISAELGALQGSNLYHSFGLFNLSQGERASFSGPAAVTNIIGRISGGEQSLIDGTVQSTITGANLFLLNPAGIFFGPNASIDVSGAFYASTAHELHFEDGAILSTGQIEAAILSTAPPSSFGFVADQNQALIVQGSRIFAQPNKTIGLIAGDIKIDGAMIGGDSATITISGISTPGQVLMDGTVYPSNESSPVPNSANITVMGESEISSSGYKGGRLTISGGQIFVDQSDILSHSLSFGNGEGIEIRGDQSIQFSHAAIQSASTHYGNAGSIHLNAPLILMDNGSGLLTSSYFVGNGGDVNIQAGELTLQNTSAITSHANDAGNAGDVSIQATDRIQMTGDPDNAFDTRITVGSYNSGNAGNIKIETPNLSLSGTTLDTATHGIGLAGNISLITGDFSLANSAQIFTASSGTMNAGNIMIEASNHVDITGVVDAVEWTGLFAIATANGNAGVIDITAKSLSVTDAWVDATISGTGKAGDILLNIENTTLLDNGKMRIINLGPGTGGRIIVNTDSLELKNDGQFNARSAASGGYGGDIDIHTRTLFMSTEGSITNEAFYNSLGTGDISVNASEQIHIIGEGESKSANPGSDVVSTGIFSFTGNIDITSPDIVMEKSGAISSRTHNDLNAGDLTVNTERLKLLSGAQISVDSFGSSGAYGLGGNAIITATESIFIDGETYSGSQRSRHSGISASTRSSGDAGEILITSPQITIQNGGLINTSTGVFGEGSAGKTTLTTDQLTISSGGGILSSSVGHGDGGDIAIIARNGIEMSDGFISAYGNSFGLPGAIEISSGNVLMDNSSVSTSSLGFRNAGNIRIISTNLSLLNDSSIRSTSENSNVDAGTINLQTTTILTSDHSSISTEATSGSGGNIQLGAHTIRLIDAPITATVAGGEGGGGNVTLTATTIGAVLESDITAKADQGLGGKIVVNTDVFLRANSVDLDASSNLEGNDGVVEINAPEMDLSGAVSELDTDFINIQSLMKSRCIAQSNKNRSSLVVSGRGGLSPAPDDYLMGSLLGIMQSNQRMSNTPLASSLLKQPLIAFGCNPIANYQ